MLEFTKDIFVFSWIEFHVFFTLKILNLEEKLLEVIGPWDSVYIDCQESLNSFEAFCELAHGSIMDWVPFEWVLLG